MAESRKTSNDMPKPKKSSADFESRFFELLDDKFESFDERLKAIETTLGKKKPPFFADKGLAWLALGCVFVFLLIVARILGIEVKPL